MRSLILTTLSFQEAVDQVFLKALCSVLATFPFWKNLALKNDRSTPV